MYNKVDTNLNFVDREAEVLKFWKENDIANKCITNREGCDTFTFYDGPPTANGKPHIGHVLTRVIKDMLPRYQSMKGKKVPTVCLLSWRLRSCWAWMARSRLRSTALSHLSRSAVSLFGSTRACGRNSPM